MPLAYYLVPSLKRQDVHPSTTVSEPAPAPSPAPAPAPALTDLENPAPSAPQDMEGLSSGESMAPTTNRSEVDSTVADSTVVTDSIVADSVVADSIVADSVVADSIAADSVVADSIVADSTVADSIAADNALADSAVVDNTVADSTVADSTVAGRTTTTTPEPQDTHPAERTFSPIVTCRYPETDWEDTEAFPLHLPMVSTDNLKSMGAPYTPPSNEASLCVFWYNSFASQENYRSRFKKNSQRLHIIHSS